VPEKLFPCPIGQVIGAQSSASFCSTSSRISNGLRGLAVHLVDEGDDRNVAQPADLEQLQRPGLDALGGVDHHHRRVHRRQRPVGVVGKVLVARRVEQVEDVPSYSNVITEVTTEMPRSRSIFIQSERVWIRSFLALTSPASWIAPPNSRAFRSAWSCRRPGER
jgi:hypothetical protein